MCTICADLRPYDPECAYENLLGSGAVTHASSAPTYSLDQVARFLNTGFWGGGQRHFDVGPGGSITYNVTALTATGQAHARDAFDAWSDVTGINFVEVGGSAQIRFDDEASGAYASYSYTNGYINWAFVNVNKNWAGGSAATDSYHYQTYLHEIGHALGLGHGGFYNGSANYGQDNLYANDSWQMSVMSYFSQWENTAVDASFAWTITPMVADILAVQQLYGTPNTRSGATIYGEGGNTGTYLDNWLSFSQPVALTIYDSGGADLIDLSSQGFSQRINLNPGTISDVQGRIGNLIIARNTMIESVATGSGSDMVTGNRADNTIRLGDGEDTASGAGGNDRIEGEGGDDYLVGGSGADELLGGSGNDTLLGGNHIDFLYGGSDDDLLIGGRGFDRLYGEDGNDQLIGSKGRQLLDGGSGDDVLTGLHGNDLLYGGDGDDTLGGGSGRDRLEGDGGNDLLAGGGGNDVLLGWDDDDLLLGGGGRDLLIGGAGNDSLNGGNSNDRLEGGDGADVLDGGRGRDRLVGGADSDIFVFTRGCGRDVIVDFDATDAAEVIDLSGLWRITDWADLSANHLSFRGTTCIINAGGGDVIALLNVSAADLDASDFLF